MTVVSYSVVWLHVVRTIVTLYRHVEMVVKCAICDMLRPLLGCQMVFYKMYDTRLLNLDRMITQVLLPIVRSFLVV